MRAQAQQPKHWRSAPAWLCRLSVVIGVALILFAGHAAAEDNYPSRPIRIIVPLAAGGPSDGAGRLAALTLSRYLKQNVFVENRTGAGGVVAVDATLAAPPDGYTLFLSNAATFTITPIARKVSYNVERDFVALGEIASAPQALVVSSTSKFKSVHDIVEYAKANPGKSSFGSAGIGTATHLSIQLLQQHASISLIHVPYRGTSISVTDVIGHNIDAVFGDVATLVPFVEDGKLTALATTGGTRSPLMPNVPTMAELGYPGVKMINWFGLHVRSKTPAAIQERLKSAVKAMQADPEFVATLAKTQSSSSTVGAEEFDRMVRESSEQLGPIIRALGPIN